ncbi:MAG: hypothetical protein J6I68_13445, partial [Butyrivibrio sp.]|uniref:hypothetical protein n=1 Tax=Butyrivibrio sp. TaxID=28121 RepID=UPI001B77E8CC
MNQKNNSGFKAPLGAILLGVTGVLTIALIASIVFSGTQMRSIEMTDEEVYYDMLYTISTDLINADRDLYQAMLAATRKLAYADYVGPEGIAVYVDDYKSNAQQALDGVNAAAELAKKNDYLYNQLKDDDGDTFGKLAEGFSSQYSKWISSYDVKNGIGDIATFDTEFDATRDYISNMSDIVEAWASQEKEANEKAINHKILVSSMTFIVIAIVLLVVTIFVIAVILKTLKRMTSDV